MTRSRHDQPSRPRPSPHGGSDEAERARIRAELAALGEPDADDDDDDRHVGAVTALFGVAHGDDAIGALELSELERRRVWRRIDERRSARPSAPRRATWIGIAAAAALVLVPVFAPEVADRSSDPGARAAREALGEQARRTLGHLPGDQDAERARGMADDYAARLRGTPNGGDR